MPNYEKMYTEAFNALTDAERMITQAAKIIKTAQQQCEEIFLAGDDTE
ncbi:MAG: hypothetical protein FWC90_03600 [Oscillospiraceae bacterium]|nr:hypothetical protein [Oscillospiraceae bacterium]